MGVFNRVKGRGWRLFRRAAPRGPAETGPRILIVSHEATRTGAPMIILNILKHFAEQTDARLETILHNGGWLAGEFQRYSQVDCLELPRKRHDELTRRVRKIVQRNRGDTPLLAVCNSMESRFIAAELADHGIPVIFLIHELPSSYQLEDYEMVFNASRRIIFPVNTVLDETDQMIGVPRERAMVLPQGLLNPEFGTNCDREQARRQIRNELKLPADARIVLGCGTLDLRKGIDHFATIARQVTQQPADSPPIHFVWVGDGPRWTHSPYHYVQLDLQKTGTAHRVHFVGERADVEPFFLGSDVFLMTSRVDPFPCVLHEAMACELPIITFDRSGGAPEAVGDGAGIVVPYGDHDQAAQMVRLLCEQPSFATNIRQRSRERVNQEFRFENYATKIIRVAEAITETRLLTPALQVFPLPTEPASGSGSDQWPRAA